MSLTDAELAAELAEEAGRLLLAVREDVGHDFPYALGEAGDVHANALLLKRLRAERPGDAVLSEEAHDDLKRLHADRVWIIDPLDGTREYSLPHREDWAVHNVHEHRTGVKAFRHPEVGLVEVAFDVFVMPGTPDLNIVTYSAPAGSDTAEKFSLLASWAATGEARDDVSETVH